jgi:predicted enzyme related to lactoylglutathione lyase
VVLVSARRESVSNTIVHFEIPADDPEALAAFYSQLFGWKIEKFPMPEGADPYYGITTVETDDNGRPTEPGVNGGMMKRVVPQQTPVNYVGVDSVDRYVLKAKELGATVVVEKVAVAGMGFFAQLVDPQGNTFAVWEEARQP